MDNLLHFNASTYTNLKADLISRNKIDCVNFDLTEIIKSYEEQASFELRILKEDDKKIVEENVNIYNLTSVPTNFSIYDSHFKNNGQIIAIVGYYVYIAKKIELKMPLEYKRHETEYFDIKYERKNKNNETSEIKNLKKTLSYKSESSFSTQYLFECGADNFIVYNCDSKTVIICHKSSIQKDSAGYTEGIKITMSCEGWKPAKKSYSYALDNNNNLIVVSQDNLKNYKNPFTYPSNELLQYNSKINGENWHEQIAREILNEYKNGRRTVSFDVPEALIPYCDEKGGPVYKKDENGNDVAVLQTAKISDLDLDTTFLISERDWTDDSKTKFAGGSYRETLIYMDADKNKEGFVTDLPRRYKITNIEYKYDGAFMLNIKGLEVPYCQLNETD